jgi:dTDP-4-dehydrorhamnose 3,5-epimerase-like enzyme
MDSLKIRYSGYVELPKITDEPDGNLYIMEGLRNIPFEIKRVYYINSLENCDSVRGHHAHRQLEQVIFCVNGSFMLDLDDGKTKQSVPMLRDNIGIILGAGLWHEMHSFSSGCVLLVVASDYYDESDYIRDYDDFLKWVATK